MPGQRRIAAHYTLCPRSGLIPRAVLTFKEDGTLISLEADVSGMDSLEGVEFYSGILIPGMVNCHTHLELSHMLGAIGPGTGLNGFLNGIKNKRESSDREISEAADYHNSVMEQEGIVGVADISNRDITFGIKAESHIDYYTFIELFNSSAGEVDSKIGTGKELSLKADSMGLRNSITPHSPYLTSDTLIKRITEANGSGKRISIHFMESRDELELFQKKGAFMGFYPEEKGLPDFLHYDSPAQRLAGVIPAETPLLLVHNTFVREEDIDVINGHFKDVTWVVCPRSNLYIENSLPPLAMMRRKGCRIAIGTDSLSSNTSLSVMEEIKCIVENYNIPLQEIIGWATLGGAEAIGINKWSGTFEAGKKPGAVLIDTTDINKDSTARRIV